MRRAAIALVALVGTAGAGPRPNVPFGSFTVEAGVGAAYVYFTCGDPDGCPANTVAPVSAALAVGEWFTQSSVVELRVADSSDRSVSTTRTLAFIGPAIQQWIGTRVWIGGGIGIAIAHAAETSVVFSFDVRAGVVLLQRGRHAWGLSIEATPAFSDNDTWTPVSLLVGYQHL